MKKIGIVIIVLLLIGAGAYFLALKKEEKVVEPVSEISKIEKVELKPSTGSKSYENPSGFRFDYPNDLEITENQDLDSKTYADLKLTSKNASGSIALKITDTKLKDVTAWLEENQEATESTKVSDMKLAEMTAKELATEKSLTLVAVDQGVLYEMNVLFDENKVYWQLADEQIRSTFAFFTPKNTPASETSENAGSSDILEEIIE